jgi:hypothetical protein
VASCRVRAAGNLRPVGACSAGAGAWCVAAETKRGPWPGGGACQAPRAAERACGCGVAGARAVGVRARAGPRPLAGRARGAAGTVSGHSARLATGRGQAGRAARARGGAWLKVRGGAGSCGGGSAAGRGPDTWWGDGTRAGHTGGRHGGRHGVKIATAPRAGRRVVCFCRRWGGVMYNEFGSVGAWDSSALPVRGAVRMEGAGIESEHGA